MLFDIESGTVPWYAANVTLDSQIWLIWGVDLVENASATERFCNKYGGTLANITAAEINLAVGQNVQVNSLMKNGQF